MVRKITRAGREKLEDIKEKRVKKKKQKEEASRSRKNVDRRYIEASIDAIPRLVASERRVPVEEDRDYRVSSNSI